MWTFLDRVQLCEARKGSGRCLQGIQLPVLRLCCPNYFGLRDFFPFSPFACFFLARGFRRPPLSTYSRFPMIAIEKQVFGSNWAAVAALRGQLQTKR